MNQTSQVKIRKNIRSEFLELLNTYHSRSGLSLREVAQASELGYSYIHYILTNARRPHRDVIIALGFAYGMERVEVDEVLLLAGYPPIGRGSLREYRQSFTQK